MTDNNYQEVIKNNKLFDGIPAEILTIPFKNENIVRRKEGEIIFQKGDESKFTYLVLAGRVKTKVYIENKSIKLNKIEKDFFGEIEVLEDTYRRSAAVANTDCILYLISKADLRTLLTEIPGINDNIIAYNKVEIPGLLITIHPDLLKKDTDKIYINSQQQIKSESENTEVATDDNLEINERNEDREENAEIDKEPNEEIAEENPEREKESNTEYRLNGSSDSESSSKPAVAEEENNYTEEVDKEVLSEENTPLDDYSGNESDKDINQIEKSQENEKTENNDETPGITNELEKSSRDGTKTTDDFTEEKPGTSEETQQLSSEFIQNKNNSEIESKWFNLGLSKPEDEISPEEEEKIKLETEEEKLKYDDTSIHTERILEAIFRINSGLSERAIHSNIVRESVKLTEAQAGVLYLVDKVKKMLVTELETEEGFTNISHPMENGLTGLAAETGEIINIREPAKDFRYSEDIDSIRGIVGSSLLCVPVINEEKETIAVISLANSSSGKFLITDEEKMLSLVPHISHTLRNISNYKQSSDQNKNIHLPTITRFITENIQTPVLTMKYYAAQIKKKNISADVKTVLNVLMDQADSIVNFLHSTLSFTERNNQLQIEEYDLREVIDDSLSLLAEYVESRNVNLYKKVESEIKIKVDKKAFYQACLQIAKNACDAMGESGNIYITAKRSGDLINIEFRDTGPGISDEVKAQLFEPFKSFKENGTGLGLSVAQKIIRDHGGELTVESAQGEGATFIISLPSFEQI